MWKGEWKFWAYAPLLYFGMAVLSVMIVLAVVRDRQGGKGSPCANRVAELFVVTSEHSMWLCENGQSRAHYRVALGSGGVGKHAQGDRKTPLGTYLLGQPRPSPRFGKFIPVEYPTAEQRSQGFTGNDVGIHGPDRRFRWAGRANTWFDWTAGCLGLGNDEELEKVASWVTEKHPTITIQ